MNAIGDLSYPVYLIHTLTLMMFGGWLLNLLPGPPSTRGTFPILAFLAFTMVAPSSAHTDQVPVADLIAIPWPAAKAQRVTRDDRSRETRRRNPASCCHCGSERLSRRSSRANAALELRLNHRTVMSG